MSAAMNEGVHEGEGYAVGNLDAMGQGPGFRKIRRELDVKELGVNAIVLPAGWATGMHYHERQEEVYFLHRGSVEIVFGEGDEREAHVLEEGAAARVDAATVRELRNPGDADAVYIVFGAEGGYVGRDGLRPEGEDIRGPRPISD